MNFIKLKSMIATIVAACLMGSLGFFVREAGMDAGITAFFRFLIGFILMSCVVLTPVLLKKRTLKFSISSFASGIAISLCILFYFFAIQKTSIGLAAFTLYLGPIFAIIGEAIISRKMPSKGQILVILIAFAGFYLISSIGSSTNDGATSTSNSESTTGMILALLSGFFYGGYILINRLIPQEVTLNTRVFWQFSAAVITIGTTLIFRDVSLSGISTGWPYIIIIGVVQGFLVLMLTGFAIKHLSSIEFGTLSYIEPLVAVILGFYLYSEDLTSMQILGILLIIAATVMQCLNINKK